MTGQTRDGQGEPIPEGQGTWQFDEGVTEVFDDMLRRSIPQYDVMRAAVTELASAFLQPDTWCVDLGCSRGEAIGDLVNAHWSDVKFVGVEVSDPMIEASRRRFAEWDQTGTVQIVKMDLTSEYPDVRASVTLAVLTLQFVPVEYRAKIVQKIFDTTVPGGAFIMVEKVIGATHPIDKAMVDAYYRMRGENGYTQAHIARKRASLAGVMAPLQARWDEGLIRTAGFRQVDCFWRWMNFAGWIAIK